jgi:hypothetical protein
MGWGLEHQKRDVTDKPDVFPPNGHVWQTHRLQKIHGHMALPDPSE